MTRPPREVTMTAGDRRYTDREVALILRRAAELEERAGVEVKARGISLGELEQIARDVGLDVARIRRAALELEAGRRFRGSISLGSPPSRTAVRGVESPLAEDALRALVRAIDDLVDAPGTVTEALGTIRWTARDRWLTTQVAVAPGADGTTVKVHERIDPRVRGLLHVVPTAWGAMAGITIAASAGLAVLPAAAILAGCALVGTAAGRGVWEILSERSQRRVDELSGELATQARSLAGQETLPNARGVAD
jgi:hypothetical protein